MNFNLRNFLAEISGQMNLIGVWLALTDEHKRPPVNFFGLIESIVEKPFAELNALDRVSRVGLRRFVLDLGRRQNPTVDLHHIFTLNVHAELLSERVVVKPSLVDNPLNQSESFGRFDDRLSGDSRPLFAS